MRPFPGTMQFTTASGSTYTMSRTETQGLCLVKETPDCPPESGLKPRMVVIEHCDHVSVERGERATIIGIEPVTGRPNRRITTSTVVDIAGHLN